jgi:hypothetical protein
MSFGNSPADNREMILEQLRAQGLGKVLGVTRVACR